jgi:hypothetical protein
MFIIYEAPGPNLKEQPLIILKIARFQRNTEEVQQILSSSLKLHIEVTGDQSASDFEIFEFCNMCIYIMRYLGDKTQV